MNALRETSDSPATRGDALVFAWRLGLPEGMNVGHAANAVLLTALSVPRSTWSRRQLVILRELMVLAGREEALPNQPVETMAGPALSESVSEPQKPVAKEDKEWWRLVGRDDSNELLGQRKTRSERVSREP